MDDVKPNFDVFSLGKVLWSMVSGKPFLRLWYFSEREYDLERIFPEEPAMRWATRIFRKCIVDQEPDCLKDAAELLRLVDETIEALGGGQVLLKEEAKVASAPIRILVYAQDGVAITEYQLLRLRQQSHSREFRTVTGGVFFHVSGGATRDVVPFEGKKVAPRTYEINLLTL
jgi:hypothetical protein